jgi:flagellar hook-associated protein 1 FlgK
VQSRVGKAVLTQLENSRDAYSGVSLDEEATDLIRFQRAYQAAARFVSVIDQLTEELVQTFGR